MKEFLYSFYGKLSAVLLLLLLILGVTQVYITYQSSMQFMQAADQRLNLNLAEKMASELEPQLSDTTSSGNIQSAIHYMMVFNPRIEIYVLDSKGGIRAYFSDPPQQVSQERVALGPINTFLKGETKELILGDDPRNPGERKPFSAAPMQISPAENGYLYIILSSERYHSSLQMIQNNYIVQTSLKILVIILGITALAGLILFGLLTRRLRTMTDKVEEFETGDYAVRLNEKSRDELGQLAGSFNHMADTIQTNLKELQKTDELRRNLIANVSHDLRSPLASMQGYLETILIKEETISKEERRQYLQVILNNTRLLRNMVNELFELSRLDAQQVNPQKEPFSIADLVQDVVLKVKPRADKKEVELAANFGRGLPQAWADISLIERVLTNLLENAIDYTPAAGHIGVSLERHGAEVEISIRDTGPGIGEEDLPHIFDRFYRADKSRSLAAGNTGLGLAIAQKILELHGTNIRVESEVGEGTCFYFRLRVYMPD